MVQSIKMSLINVNGLVVPIQKQIMKKIIREVSKAKCHGCSKQYKPESFANMVI